MLIFTTNNRVICVSNSERRHYKTLLEVMLDTLNFTSGMNTPLSGISYHSTEEACLCKWLLSLRNESEHPVGAPVHQWVGCRDHAGNVCFPHSGSWQVQGGPAYICRDQRKPVFHNMGPLIVQHPQYLVEIMVLVKYRIKVSLS